MIRKILLATDLSPASREAVATTRTLARVLGATVVLLHAIEPIDPGDEVGAFADFYASLSRKAQRRLRELARRLAADGIEAQPRIIVDRRWRAIVDVAEQESIDLIVMGSRAPIEGERVAVGSTSHKVFLAARTPLLVVRGEGKRKP